MRLLLVEDDQLLGQGILKGLQQGGYAVNWVKDGETARSTLYTESYDIVVLDLGLPSISGLDIVDWMRQNQNDTPVLILTARDAVSDRVAGLDRGADDYMVKPFDLDELHARIRALLRRKTGRATPVLTHRDIELDPASHTLKKKGKPIQVSTREFVLLQTLLENSGRVMSRHRLEDSLYSWKTEVDSNAVEVHIHHLRKKIGENVIRTIRGVGYTIDKI